MEKVTEGVVRSENYSGMAVNLHDHLLIDKEEKMLKIRLQGTTRDIKWFFKILARDKRLYLHDPSEPLDIKGSRRFKRAYAQIFRDEDDYKMYQLIMSDKNSNKSGARYHDTGVVFGCPVSGTTNK